MTAPPVPPGGSAPHVGVALSLPTSSAWAPSACRSTLRRRELDVAPASALGLDCVLVKKGAWI